MSHLPPRIRVLTHRQAWPWRWEMALLECGCRDGWLLPEVCVLAERARALGEELRRGEGPAALAFEGYTLVGACWRSPAAVYVMPAQRASGLPHRLQEALTAPATA